MTKILYALGCLCFLLLSNPLFADRLAFERQQTRTGNPASAPVVSNLNVSQRTDGSKIVDIWFDLEDANGDSCETSVVLSSDGGIHYDLMPTFIYLSGDIGSGVLPGTGKHISWFAGAESYTLNSTYRYKVIADDYSDPEDFVLIVGYSNNFWMSKYEVTQGAFNSVMGYNPSGGYNIGPTYPVYNVTYGKAVEYCNWRSIQDGLEPVYYFGDATVIPYVPITSNPSEWPAGLDQNPALVAGLVAVPNRNGYRLPTLEEWQLAASGGLVSNGYDYSGSNDIGEVAWYALNSGYMTSPVGQKAPNELGIYDMNGNVWEYIDGVEIFHYTHHPWDPPGLPDYWTSKTRITGGGWFSSSTDCVSGYVISDYPNYLANRPGFRVCRNWSGYGNTVATPVIDLPSGEYDHLVQVTLSCDNPDAVILFSTDGNIPLPPLGTPYTGPFTLDMTTCLKAIAFVSGYNYSLLAEANYTFNIPNPPPDSLVLIEGGMFNNGTSNIHISSFYISTTELRQADYTALMGNSHTVGYGNGSLFPVNGVTWFNAIRYCNKRSLMEGLTPCYSYGTYGTDPDSWPTGFDLDVNHTAYTANWSADGYRLPTEMEWMYAARGGNLSQNNIYSGSNEIDSVGWCHTNAFNHLQPVAALNPNELGLYDMSGNAWEWCWDKYASSYPAQDQTNPTGSETGSCRLLRGGSVVNPASECTPGYRYYQPPSYSNPDVGFRICKRYKNEVQVVASPVISPTEGIYYPMVNVSISCPTPSATIRYTIDGTIPTASTGYVYTVPFTITSTTTVKAIACLSLFTDSPLATAVYTIQADTSDGFIHIREGIFNNGTADITVSGFYMDRYEVTQTEFQFILGYNPSSGYGLGSNYPVYSVSWFNAIEYCNRRSLMEGIIPCYSYGLHGSNPHYWPDGWNTDGNQNQITCNWIATGYRLPTEMEWMFAARGGNLAQGYVYCGSNQIDSVGWCSSNSGNTYHPTGMLDANELGLYDMSGNAWEWCWDFYATSYPTGAQTNPNGPETGSYRVIRGGSAYSPANQCTADFRNCTFTGSYNYTIGFRLCRSDISNIESIATPAITPQSGYYGNVISVAITCETPGTTIRYTTNGITPTFSNSLVYTEPIHLGTGAIVKAIAFMDRHFDSECAQTTYSFPDLLTGDLAVIETGSFNNGTADVILSGFKLDECELTQADYQFVMGTNPASGYGVGDNYPVYNVSWQNAIKYCNIRSILAGLMPCYSYSNFGTNPDNWPAEWNIDSNQNLITCNWSAPGYRLPTEMEWMFAARGGNLSQGFTYCGANDIDSVGWCSSNSGEVTHQTGVLNANEQGLSDMSGNVWEWCWDYFADNYPSYTQTNPRGPVSGAYRLLRGASAFSPENQCTPVFRNYIWPSFTNYSIGFRTCRIADSITETVAPPLFIPSGGDFTSSVLVSIDCATPNAVIRYTLDGTTPTATTGLFYNEPMMLNSSATIQAIAFLPGYNDSQVTTETFTIQEEMESEFSLIESGTFHNGFSEVTLSDYYLSKYEISQAKYQLVMGSNPSSGYGVGDNYPVYNTSWFNAVEYCNRRSNLESLTPCYSYSTYGTNPDFWPSDWDTDGNQGLVSCNWASNGYRLPTEMEWMYAAKGGNLSNSYVYCGSNEIDSVGWYNLNAGNTTHPEGSLAPNEQGLYDMSGNVWEWCWDYHADNYPGSVQNNPTGPISGVYRIIRGASAFSPADQCTPAFRNCIWPTYTSYSIGFRIARRI